MAVFSGCGCRGKGGCLVAVIITIIILVVLSGVGYKFITETMYTQLLKEMGFQTEQEFNEFSDKMNAPFDDADILIDMPTTTDATTAKQILSACLQLSNGESVFLPNGTLNTGAMQNKGDVILINDMALTSQQLAYAINLFLTSPTSESDIELAQEVQLKQIDYQFITSDSAKINFYIDINAVDIKNALGKLGKCIPDRLLLNIGATLTNTNGKIMASGCTFALNKLDADTTARFIGIIAKLTDKSSAQVKQWMGDLIASLFNDFCTSLDCKLVFSEDLITFTKVEQGE